MLVTTQAPGAAVQLGDLSLAADVVDLIEILAVVVIAFGVVAASVSAVITHFKDGSNAAFTEFKRLMARGLLIGLDLLIAADIIKTVTLDPTLENVLALGILVLIRIFLSWSLILEVEGHWPWQPSSNDDGNLNIERSDSRSSC
jgi:uncharacterized membrane protein